MLIIFLLSNAPQQYLHDTFASHTDVTVKCSHDKKSGCYHHSEINCHFEKLFVVNDAFEGSSCSFPAGNFSYRFEYAELNQSDVSISTFTSGNKGPPSKA